MRRINRVKCWRIRRRIGDEDETEYDQREEKKGEDEDRKGEDVIIHNDTQKTGRKNMRATGRER